MQTTGQKLTNSPFSSYNIKYDNDDELDNDGMSPFMLSLTKVLSIRISRLSIKRKVEFISTKSLNNRLYELNLVPHYQERQLLLHRHLRHRVARQGRRHEPQILLSGPNSIPYFSPIRSMDQGSDVTKDW